jgi:hypothetical protein
MSIAPYSPSRQPPRSKLPVHIGDHQQKRHQHSKSADKERPIRWGKLVVIVHGAVSITSSAEGFVTQRRQRELNGSVASPERQRESPEKSEISQVSNHAYPQSFPQDDSPDKMIGESGEGEDRSSDFAPVLPRL